MTRRTTSVSSGRRDKLVDHWDRTIQLLPGYDPVATARKEHYFDCDAAQRVVDFFAKYLKFVEGEVAGQPFILEPWAEAIVGNLFGWKVEGSGVRRYREGLVLVARKNNKTTLGAAIMLYTLFCDGEQRAQCYSMAAEKKQASFAFDIAKLMVQASPSLASRSRRVYSRIVFRNSWYEAISSEAYSKHSMNPHAVLSDELHCQPNSDLYEAIKTGRIARRQPFILHITTSDFDREASLCNKLVDYSCEVRDGTVDNPRWLPAIYAADKGAAYDDEEQWAKANPNLGKSVKIEDLREFADEAKHDLAWRSTFQRLHMNIRTEQSIEIIPMEDWDACAGPVDEDKLVGRTCHAGLDLANRQDLTAWVLIFEPAKEGQAWAILPRFWCPRSVATERQATNRWPYLQWEDQGYLTVTEGDVIQYDLVERQVVDDCERFGIPEAAADPWNLAYLQQNVLGTADIELVNFGQGFANMTNPIKELLSMLASRQIAHGGNPVLRWMAQGCSAKENSTGGLMFDKKGSKYKIDGMVALAMALGMAMNSDDRGCDYEAQGLGAM